MASAPLLARVSGLGPGLAEAIVAHRDANGAFATRRKAAEGRPPRPARLRAMRRLPAHPRRRGAARRLGGAPRSLWRGAADRCRLRPRPAGADGRHRRAAPAGPGGLRRPKASACRPCATSSPRSKSPAATRAPASSPPASPTASRISSDLQPGMALEGTVTNVAAFGAFVDIGVHQDGLVHVSQLADRFVKDPHEVVKAGDVVRVRVTEVDIPRKRIGLTMRKRWRRLGARGSRRPRCRSGRTARQGRPRPASGGAETRRRRGGHRRLRRGAARRDAQALRPATASPKPSGGVPNATVTRHPSRRRSGGARTRRSPPRKTCVLRNK